MIDNHLWQILNLPWLEPGVSWDTIGAARDPANVAAAGEAKANQGKPVQMVAGTLFEDKKRRAG